MSFLHDGVTTFTNLLGTGNTNPGLIQNGYHVDAERRQSA